ncbi:MAG: metallophosphatase family protein [Elusimicrobiales bacterium]|nr:metallophosphatase family protein [Elusimicrobiales bacterium]
MEKLVLLSDIHANLPALEAVTADISRRGLAGAPVCFLGDAVNLGPFPAEAVGLLRSLKPAFRVRGNHDRYAAQGVPRPELERYLRCAEGADHALWTAAALSAEDKAWLGAAPQALTFRLGGAEFSCFHASAESDEGTFKPGLAAGNFLCGHSHAPYVVSCPGGLAVNPGSVGGPLDRNTAAAYAVLSVNGSVGAEIIRVPYDLDAFSQALARREVPWGAAINSVVRRAHF